MIQYQILQTSITRTIWQTVRRNTNEILRVKGLILTQIFTNEEPPFSGNTLIVSSSSLLLLLEIQRFKLCNFNPAPKTTFTTFPQTICQLFMITNYNNHHNCVTNLFWTHAEKFLKPNNLLAFFLLHHYNKGEKL